MVILIRVNVSGVNNFAAGPLYGVTIFFSCMSVPYKVHQKNIVIAHLSSGSNAWLETHLFPAA